MTDKAWSGKVDKDSIRVYNRALTSEEVVRIMTHDEIMQLTGRELDAAVAKARGLIPCTSDVHKNGYMMPCYATPEYPDQGGELECYSTDIRAAWELVEEMNGTARVDITRWKDGGYRIILYSFMFPKIEVSAKTAPEAICRAYLLAVQP